MNPWLKIVLIIIALYAVAWALFGVEYLRDRNSILRHYGGKGTYLGCGGGMSIPSLGKLRIAPKSYILPPLGITYSINTKTGGTASGTVNISAIVKETSNKPYVCTLQ